MQGHLVELNKKKETFLDHLSIEAIAMVRYTIYTVVNRLYKRLTTVYAQYFSRRKTRT